MWTAWADISRSRSCRRTRAGHEPVEYLWTWRRRHALANYCPNDHTELHAIARNKLKSAQKRPSIIAACWMQATLC